MPSRPSKAGDNIFNLLTCSHGVAFFLQSLGDNSNSFATDHIQIFWITFSYEYPAGDRTLITKSQSKRSRGVYHRLKRVAYLDVNYKHQADVGMDFVIFFITPDNTAIEQQVICSMIAY